MTDTSRWTVLLSFLFLLLLGILYLLQPILSPFLIALLLSYMANPMVNQLQTYKLSRTWSVIIVFATFTTLALTCLLIIIPLLEQQMLLLRDKLPVYIEFLQTRIIPAIASSVGKKPDFQALQEALREHWHNAGNILGPIIQSLSKSWLALLTWFGNLFLVPVVVFYLLRDWPGFIRGLQELLPQQSKFAILSFFNEADQVLAAFFRGQFLVMLLLGMIYSIGLALIDLEFALLLGMISGLVAFVPYLGFIVGIVLASIVALFQYQDLFQLLPVFLVFGIGQILESMVLTPLLIGESIGLHPVTVIFAVLAGGQLFGFVGVLLALPAAAVIMVLLRLAHGFWLQSHYYLNNCHPEQQDSKSCTKP